MNRIAPQPDFINTEPSTTPDNFSRRRRSRFKPLGGPLSGPRYTRLVRHLHRLGEKPISELLRELTGNDYGLQADTIFLLERYGELDPEIVRALGADDFAPSIFAVKVS